MGYKFILNQTFTLYETSKPSLCIAIGSFIFYCAVFVLFCWI